MHLIIYQKLKWHPGHTKFGRKRQYRAGQPTTVTFQSGAKRAFSVCFPSLNSRYRRAYQMLEMMDVGRLLGAERYIALL